MHFINLVKLASYYIKNNIPLDKEILTTCTNQIESRDNPKHAHQWLDIIGQSHIDFSKNMMPHLNLLSPILGTSLSIDSWWSGIDYEILNYKHHLDGLIYIIHTTENKHIISSQPVSEDEYHNLQQSLYNFAKALLSYLTKKNQNPIYSTELFDMWMNI